MYLIINVKQTNFYQYFYFYLSKKVGGLLCFYEYYCYIHMSTAYYCYRFFCF